MAAPANSESKPLRHRCYMTKGRFGFISYIDFSDLIVLGTVFYLSTTLSSKLFISPAPKLFLGLIMLVLAWAVNFGVKKRLMPYPGLVEHFINWWMGGIDHYEPDVDEKPIPLLITRELEVGNAVTIAATRVRLPKPNVARRRKSV